jgi:hypothetical protein
MGRLVLFFLIRTVFGLPLNLPGPNSYAVDPGGETGF